MVSGGSIAAGVVETNDPTVSGFVVAEFFPVRKDLPGFDVNVGKMKLGRVERKWRGPQKLSGCWVESEHRATLSDSEQNVSHLASRDVGTDPFHGFRIWIQSRSNERPFITIVQIPFVAG